MAMTATIASNPASTAVTEQPVTMVLTISNSGASVVHMTAIVPYAQPTGSVKSVMNSGVSFGQINFGPNSNLAVPAGGSLVVTFPVTFHAPSSGYLSDVALTYDIGATCYSDDNSVFVPTADTITVNYAVTFSEDQQ